MIPEYDITGTEFVNGATNFNLETMEEAMRLAGIHTYEDARDALFEMSHCLFRSCQKCKIVDPQVTTQFPSGKKSVKFFIRCTQVVVDPILPEGPIQRVRIYDKNDQLVGLMKVRES